MTAIVFANEAFDCLSCATSPQLQTHLGCFKSTPEPVTEINEFKFRRCPVAHHSVGANQLMMLYQNGAMTATFETKMGWPPKRLAGLNYMKYLHDLKEASK